MTHFKRRIAVAAISMFCVPAFASVVNETAAGAGNTPGTAQAIAGSAFTLPNPATVFPATVGTATIAGGLQTNGDVDFYSFSLTNAEWMNFDIDDNPFTFDTILSLFNSAGTLVAFDDDSGLPADSGSASALDSFLGRILLQPDTYFIAVSRFANFATQSSTPGTIPLLRPDGVFGGRLTPNAAPGVSTFSSSIVETAAGGTLYSLHVTQGVVPEPATLALLGVGLAGLGFSRRKQ